MNGDQFQVGIDMLVAATRPYRWNNDSQNIYWKVFNRVDAEIWMNACNRLVTTVDEMPTIPVLKKEIGPQRKYYEDCEHCDKGRVRFAVYNEKKQVEYDCKFCACNHCAAGEEQAERLVRLAKRAARDSGSLPRYTMPEEFMWDAVSLRFKTVPIIEPEPTDRFSRRIAQKPTTNRARETKQAFDALMKG